MILLVLSFQTRRTVAEDEGGTKAVAQAELTFVIFDYEEGQDKWIPGLEALNKSLSETKETLS